MEAEVCLFVRKGQDTSFGSLAWSLSTNSLLPACYEEMDGIKNSHVWAVKSIRKAKFERLAEVDQQKAFILRM